MICTRFRLVYDLSNHRWIDLGTTQRLPAVPSCGDLVNFDGNPYRVIAVGWVSESHSNELWAYVEMQKAGNFAVEIGGKTY